MVGGFYIYRKTMKEFIKDLETFIKKNWKSILLIVGVSFLISKYPDIKSGIIDGWSNK